MLIGSDANNITPTLTTTAAYLIIQALENYYKYYQDELQVELPAHSGNMVNLKTVADELRNKLTNIFVINPLENEF